MSNRHSLDPTSILNLYVSSTKGNLVPLSSVAYVTEEGVAAELEAAEK